MNKEQITKILQAQNNCSGCVCVNLQSSSTELLQRACKLVERGLENLAKGIATVMPQDCSAITDAAFMLVSNSPCKGSVCHLFILLHSKPGGALSLED